MNPPVQYPIGKLWNTLRYWTYPWTTGFVVQSQDVLTYFSVVVQKKEHVIPNPLVLPPDSGEVEANRMTQTVIAMGRLVKQKGFDLLLKAFANIAQKPLEWSLVMG